MSDSQHTSLGASAAGAALWTPEELADAVRRRAHMHTCVRGISGVITGTRDGFVILELPFGKGIIRLEDVVSQPPQRFAPGARVRTPFGKGVVKRCRTTMTNIDYEVELIDIKLASPATQATEQAAGLARLSSEGNLLDAAEAPKSACAMGYLNSDAVTARTELSAEEALADAAALRTSGNDALKEKRFEEAITAYKHSIEALSKYRGVPLQLDAILMFKDAAVKALSNSAQAYLSRGKDDDFEQVAAHVHEALAIDPANRTKQHEKLYFRRAMAFMGMKEWKLAIEDLKQQVLTESAAARAKLEEARKQLKAETDRQKKTWSRAFSKHAEEEDKIQKEEAAAAAAASASSSPAPERTQASAAVSTPQSPQRAAAGGAAAFASPNTGTPSSQPTGMAKKFAGRTPHPRGKWNAARAGDEADDEEETQDEAHSSGSATATAVADSTETSESTTSWLTYAGYAAAGAAVIGGAALLMSAFRGRGGPSSRLR